MTVENLSPPKPLQKLYQRMERFAEQDAGAVEKRLAELNREFSVGQLVKATTAALLVLSVGLAVWTHVWPIIIVAITGIVLLQYPFERRSCLGELFWFCGFRSGAQIEADRTALKTTRSDDLERSN